jgi:phosphohistidine phosphatase
VLYLLRHAKSAWDDPALADHDRPLNDRGRRAAPAMGNWLREHDCAVAQALVSTAERARQTWELVSARLKRPPEAAYERGLYLCGAQALLGRLRQVDADRPSCMLIAHNPDMQQLALTLAGNGDVDVLAAMRGKYPTAALAILSFAGSWRDLDRGCAVLTDFVRPKDLA